MYQNDTEGKVRFFDRKLSKSSEFYYLEPGLYPSITDIVEAKNILIQESHIHSENCIKVKVSRRTQKPEIYLANERSGLAFFVTDLGHIFGNKVGIKFGVMLRGNGPHQPEFAYDIIRIHSLMIYNDLIEYNVDGNTKAPVLRCFLFISKLKSGDIITTGQYMNYQTFSKLQFRPLFKKSFHSIHIDLRDTSGDKRRFVSVGISRLVLMFRKDSNIPLYYKKRYKMDALRQIEIPFYRGVGRQRGQRLSAFAQVIGRTSIPFLRK